MPSPTMPAPAYTATVADLSAKLTTPPAVQPDERAYFAASISDAQALEAGARVESATVLDEVLRIGALAIPHIVAGKIVGYGPLRTRYLLDLSKDLAGKVDTLDNSRVEAVGAGAAKTTSLRGTREIRRQAIRALKTLAGGREEQKKRLKRAQKGKEKPDERARVLDALATELETAIAAVPATVAADAGATPELVTALKQSAAAVLATRGEAQDARGTVASIYDAMNLLDGKILHELRLLVGAMTDARRGDKSVPAVRSAILRNGRKKAAAAKAAKSPATPATPASSTTASAPATPSASAAETPSAPPSTPTPAAKNG